MNSKMVQTERGTMEEQLPENIEFSQVIKISKEKQYNPHNDYTAVSYTHLVGSSKINTFRSTFSNFANTTFCWLPPDREDGGSAISFAFN